MFHKNLWAELTLGGAAPLILGKKTANIIGALDTYYPDLFAAHPILNNPDAKFVTYYLGWAASAFAYRMLYHAFYY